MIKIVIQKVEIVEGDYFKNVTWRNKMQIIHTDKGLFIDNIKGSCFGRSNIQWRGINWTEHIGKTVEIIVVNDFGKEINGLGLNEKECLKNCGKKERTWAYPYFLLGEPKR